MSKTILDPQAQIDSNSALIHGMTGCLTDDQPLCKAIMTWLTSHASLKYTLLCHQREQLMIWNGSRRLGICQNLHFDQYPHLTFSKQNGFVLSWGAHVGDILWSYVKVLLRQVRSSMRTHTHTQTIKRTYLTNCKLFYFILFLFFWRGGGGGGGGGEDIPELRMGCILQIINSDAYLASYCCTIRKIMAFWTTLWWQKIKMITLSENFIMSCMLLLFVCFSVPYLHPMLLKKMSLVNQSRGP